MTLDKLLKDNAAWLDQIMKRPAFAKVDEKALALPEEQRQQRIADLKARIDALSRRKADAVASYDRAIALEQVELNNLMAEKPPASLRTLRPKAGSQQRKKKRRA